MVSPPALSVAKGRTTRFDLFVAVQNDRSLLGSALAGVVTSRTFGPLLGAAIVVAALNLTADSRHDAGADTPVGPVTYRYDVGADRRVGPVGTGAADEPQQFLRTVAGFSTAELAALDRGEAIAKVLPTDKREIAIVGAVRVKAAHERLFEQYRDVSGLRRSQVFQEVGTFGATPRADDLRGLTLENYDLDTIRTCKPRDCGVRLPTGSLEYFQREVDWSAADWRERAGQLWRRLLAGYAAGYVANGNKALAEYQNKELPLSVAKELQVLFDESRYFRSSAPEFFGYLEEFPATPLEGAEDLLYWDKEAFGLRPVLSITHMTLYASPPSRALPAGPSAFVATKQIYATHYFDAALGLTLAFDDHDSGFYMLCINRARTRSLTSFIRGVVRMAVQRKSRDAMEKILGSTKLTLERQRGRQDGAGASHSFQERVRGM